MNRHICILQNIALSLLSIFAGLAITEMGYRLAKGSQRIYRPDTTTGWAPKENISITKELTTQHGRKYTANYSTDSKGARKISPALKSKKNHSLRVLAIGDSYTAEFYSSNDDAWFGILQQRFPEKLDVTAYGIGGSGATQQHLAFKRIFHHYKPHVLLIQFCTNDIGDDSFSREFSGILRNQDLRRPYFKNGYFYFHNSLEARIYRFLYNSFWVFQKVDNIIQSIQSRQLITGETRKSLSDSRQDKIDSLEWEEAYTAYIDFARKSGVNEIWTVSCRPTTSSQVLDANAANIWLKTSNKLGIIVFESFGESVEAAERSGLDVRAADGGHFNDLGNRIAGNALADEIQTYLTKERFRLILSNASTPPYKSKHHQLQE